MGPALFTRENTVTKAILTLDLTVASMGPALFTRENIPLRSANVQSLHARFNGARVVHAGKPQ